MFQLELEFASELDLDYECEEDFEFQLELEFEFEFDPPWGPSKIIVYYIGFLPGAYAQGRNLI